MDWLHVGIAQAQFYNGGGVPSGLGAAVALGTGGANLRSLVLQILFNALLFVGLLAVITIVIAGIILVVGGVSDQARERAKNMVIFAVIGLLVIILATPLVLFVDSLGR